MNAERFHAIVTALSQEMAERNLVGKMQELINALQNVVSQPQHPAHQQSLANSLKSMYSATTDAPSDRFSPTWRQILSEIGGEDLFGNALEKTIKQVFERNQITPAVALQELQGIQKRLQAFKNALEQAISALRHFRIGDETLSPGQCEIGLLIPRKAVSNCLPELAEELKELSFILNAFSEVATGKKVDLPIRSISSTDLMVYLDAVLPFAACLAVAIERTVTLYKQLLEIRKLREDLRKQGVPDEQTVGIEDYANKLIEGGIEKASVEIIDKFYHQKDGGRKNELLNAVRISLNKIANRIDRGYNLEVRVEPIQAKEEDTKKDQHIREAILTIQSATPKMQFLKLEGEPILKLPEGKEKAKKKE